MTKEKSLFRFLVFLSFCALVLAGASALYVYHVRNALNRNVLSYLNEVALRGVKILHTQINGNLNSLKSAAAAISSYAQDSVEKQKWIDLLEEEARHNSFEHMGFATPDGKAYLSDGFSTDVSQTPFFQQALSGRNSVTFDRPAKNGQDPSLVLSIPFFHNGKIEGVLFASIPLEAYGRLLASDSFDGKGYSVVVNSQGNKIAISDSAKADLSSNNIFQSKKNVGLDKTGKMYSDMQKGLDGTRRFFRPGEGWLYVSYVPVGLNDWYMLSVVPEKVATEQTKNIFSLSLILCVANLFILTAFFIFIYWQNKRQQKQLYHAAYTDPLTLAPTWAKTQQIIENLLKSKDISSYAFVLFDVNKFKVANEMLGYEKANILLQHIAKTVRENLQKQESFCRIHADVFQMLLRFQNPEELKKRLETLNEKIISSLSDQLGAFQLILSFGVYPISKAPTSPNELWFKAATARDLVKGKYNDIVGFYDDSLKQQLELEQSIENHMEGALLKKEFKLFFQPICKPDGSFSLAEAHLQWHLPPYGKIEEETWQRVFTKNGFIARLDLYLAEKICQWLQQQIKQKKEFFPVILNLSVESLSNPQLANILCQLIKKYELENSYLILQAAPQSKIKDITTIQKMANRLYQAGFSLSLDRLGSGNIPLDLLKLLPLEMVKTDQKIVKDLEENERARRIADSLIYMTHQLKIKIIFDGVETEKQSSILKNLGADLLTGPFKPNFNEISSS